MRVLCDIEPPHTHDFPDDWEFGGPRGTDWRTDPRWVPSVYIYLDDHLREVWRTSEPKCLDAALDQFTQVADLGATFLQYSPERGELQLAPFTYDPKTDLLTPLEA